MALMCEMVGSHIAKNIVISLRKTLSDWDIEHLFASIRDHGSNVVAATHQLGSVCEWDLDCSGHKLNTCITSSISNTLEVKEAIDLVRCVIHHIKKSPKSWNLLKDDYISRNQGRNPSRPCSDSKTRWFFQKWTKLLTSSLPAINTKHLRTCIAFSVHLLKP